jgi:hypothetical protein
MCTTEPTLGRATDIIYVCAPDATLAAVRGNRVAIKQMRLAPVRTLRGTTCEATTQHTVPYYDLGPDADW